MNPNISLKNLPAWEYTNDVNNICQPLFNRFGLTYFDYCLFYNDGSGFILINNRKWLEYYFNKKFKIGSTLCESGMHLWLNYIGNEVVKDARDYFNQDYGMSVFKKHKNYVEYFDFATYRGNHKILDFYLNNLDLLENFLNYFKYKAQKLIENSIKEKFFIPCEMKGKQNISTESEHQFFLELIRPNKYYLEIESSKKYLTKREHDTLKHFSKGYTMKEIGKIMQISPRTVEDYLLNIRNKLGVENKTELIQIISDLKIDLL